MGPTVTLDGPSRALLHTCVFPRVIMVATLSVTAGCGGFGDGELRDRVAVTPTWDGQVRAILARNCVECHTDSPANGAPDTFRLDKYQSSDGDDEKDGAFEKRSRIRARAVGFVPSQMPPSPRAPLTLDERAVLDAWIEAGAPKAPDGSRTASGVIEP